ncbi:phospholipase D-like domain-containing protein [Escherichia coli]|uniref:phospholipase D-like domain-containing protein n=1 Tax=Escherichia coli TaxID=562 RepID=UPI003D9BA7EC
MKKGAIIFLTGVLAFSSLPSIAADSPSVQVGFSPEGSAQTLVIGAIDSAQSSIRMMAYSFTAMDIMQALVKAKNRGVGVLRRNPRFFRYPSFSPATSASRSIISLLLWKV